VLSEILQSENGEGRRVGFRSEIGSKLCIKLGGVPSSQYRRVRKAALGSLGRCRG
jgi:hypothetical protein